MMIQKLLIHTIISNEIKQYTKIQMKKEQKANIHLMTWWQDRKSEYPYLFKAVKALLCTPVTSVPSKRYFQRLATLLVQGVQSI